MIRCVIYTAIREEGQRFRAAISDRAALATEDALEGGVFTAFKEAAEELSGGGSLIIGWDMDDAAGREALAAARRGCREGFLAAIASAETSPLTFLNPAIAPSSLIFHPFQASELRRVAAEAVRDVQRRFRSGDTDRYLTVSSKNEQLRIACEDIYYVEARGRKLYVRLRGEEVGFSGVLEQVLERLPDQFKRCHRSYIVNIDKIERLQFPDNLIYLADGMCLPLSRSCKAEIRKYCHG